ncbi:hypothetical protein SDC9_98943 [bioreactor metagenome]|uniref:Uncharacterized protein n=1 Tax=bioreactor metagenome TaxID=1076179 RepID=A0A645AGP2_9ZZZZ
MIAEGLALQKLQHHRGKRLADAVDLVQKENPLFDSGPLHQVVDRSKNFAHGILRDGELMPAVGPLFDKRQTHGALPGVMRDGVGHQPHAGLRCDLLHDLGFADARRPHQQHRPLTDGGNQVVPQIVPGQIRSQGIGNFLFRLFDVHKSVSL